MIFFAFSSTSGTNLSATRSCTRMRFTAVQRWPEFLVAPGNGKLGRLVEIGIGEIVEHDQRIVAAELERGAPVAGLRRR